MNKREREARAKIGKAVGRVATQQGDAHTYGDRSHLKDAAKKVGKKLLSTNSYIDGTDYMPIGKRKK